MLSDKPIIQGVNNSTLSGIRAMPIKDSTSTGDSGFSINRRAYIDSYIPTPTKPLVKVDNHTINTHTSNRGFGFKGFALINHTNTSQASTVQKKWINWNRDASQIVANRRINSVGNGTLNAANAPMSFTSHISVNVVNEASRRARSGGASAPAKKIYKNMDYANIF